MSLTVAAVRGTISVPANTVEVIRTGHVMPRSRISRAQPGSTRARRRRGGFTATPDLTADFPAHSSLGWTDVPLLGAIPR